MAGGTAPTEADFHEAIANRADRWFAACLRITRSPELAEDAVQEALLSAWHKRDQFKHGSRLETWIHRIAINAALQQLRKAKPGMFEPLVFEVDFSADILRFAAADSNGGNTGFVELAGYGQLLDP